MGRYGDWLFKIGYYPIYHQSVKRNFINWYYEAATDHRIIEGLEADNSKLRRLCLEAATEAENFDEEFALIELLDIIEGYIGRLEAWLHYLALAFIIAGLGAYASGLYFLKNMVFQLPAIVMGSLFFVPPLGVVAFYHVLKHQMRSNAQFISRFNQQLTERPGDVRRHDREWSKLAAQYFWNKSLLRPNTINVLIILSVIQALSPRLFGYISGDLHANIREYIGKDAKEILKLQFNRFQEGDIPQYSRFNE